MYFLIYLALIPITFILFVYKAKDINTKTITIGELALCAFFALLNPITIAISPFIAFMLFLNHLNDIGFWDKEVRVAFKGKKHPYKTPKPANNYEVGYAEGYKKGLEIGKQTLALNTKALSQAESIILLRFLAEHRMVITYDSKADNLLCRKEKP